MKTVFLLYLVLFCSFSKASEKITAGLVVNAVGLGDHSFNDSAASGLKRAADVFGIHTRILIPKTPEETADQIVMLVASGYDIVISVGYSTLDAVEDVARRHPEADFAVIDAVSSLPNIRSVTFRDEEGAFLAGVMAAGMSQSKTAGFLGGKDIPLIHRFELGFSQGAHYREPQIKVLTRYAKGFGDQSGGKKLSFDLRDKGADVIFHAAGSTGLGLINAAREGNFYAIGVDMDQDSLAPGNVLCSMIKDIGEAVYQTVKDTVSGDFKPGLHEFGLSDGGIRLSDMKYTKDKIPAELLVFIEQARRDIISGKIRINSSRK